MTEPTQEPLSEETQFALKKAEQIAAAIEKKLVGYKTYVRLCQSTEYSFIEIGIRKNGDVPANEKQVAYGQTWFEEMKTTELTLARANRMLNEVRIHLGMGQE